MEGSSKIVVKTMTEIKRVLKQIYERIIGDEDLKRSLIWGVVGINIIFTFMFTGVDTLVVNFYAKRLLPYSFIWFWLNPVYLGVTQYKVILLVLQMVMVIPMWWLVKKGRMNKFSFCLYFLTTAYYRLAYVYQEITPTVLLPFAQINPLFVLSFVIQKLLPFSMMISTTDPGFGCFMANLTNGICGTVKGNGISLTQQDFYAHLTFVWWMVIPTYAWLRKRGSKPWNEKRYWTIWGILLIVIIIIGIIVTYAFPYKFTWCAPGFTDWACP
jgi:hypothetical protein